MMIVDPSQNAKGRLLPWSVPFRFFAAAAVFHILAWLFLLLNANAAGGLSWPMLACLHLITLGVLAMTAVGASFQLLPVATRRAVRDPKLCKLVFWLLGAGLILFVCGLLVDQPVAAAAGGVLAALALGGAALLLVDNLRGVDDMPVVTGHAWGAALCLFALLLLGALLALNLATGFIEDRSRFLLAHGILALFGFMGLLAQGFSTILLPMFALSFAPSRQLGLSALACNLLGVSLAALGAIIDLTPLLAMGGVLGLVGTLLMAWSLIKSFKKRLRKRTGFFFLPIWTGVAMGPVALLFGLAALFGLLPGALFAWVAVMGWLLTFVLGVLQRIMPFLASMHSVPSSGRTPLLSQLMAEGWSKAHFALHVPAVALVGVGLALDASLWVQAGAGLGLAGSLCFAAYGLELFRRARRFKNNPA